MHYRSTRGEVEGLSFEDAVMMGLAEDGGLLIPDELPEVSQELGRWRALGFPELGAEILRRFVNEEIPLPVLQEMLERSYRSFRDPDVTPLRKVGNLHLLELFHGPTFAFKDVALQFLGNLFEYFLQQRQHPLRILGATSGDTGSAAIHGMRGRQGVEVFMLHPEGRVSPVQERQMTTVLDSNIHNLAVTGVFDDAQSIVKALFGDLEFKRRYHLGAVNSINWARVLAQIVYYFHAALRVAPQGEPVHFVVPSGNFGNILAGYYAKHMGLSVGRLVVATNQNDILHRFFSAGQYHQASVRPTLSPSMDIQISSNFERYLFDLSGQQPAVVCDWMEGFRATGKLSIDEKQLAKAQAEFDSARADDAAILETIRKTHRDHGYVLDPHTATGVHAARTLDLEGPVVVLACAHPGKFSQAVEQAIGEPLSLPAELQGLAGLETRKHVLPATSEAVREFIEAHVQG